MPKHEVFFCQQGENAMTIADVVKVLNGKLVAGDGASPRAVGAVVANDLMSDVLLFDADDPLLLTSLASDQAIRTAHIVGAMGVVIHNAKPLSETMIKVADDLHIPLVSSPLSKYDACVKMHDALEMEKRG
jgi:predicted transcriptional regulator